MGTRRWRDLTIVAVLALGAIVLAVLDLPIPLVRAVIGVPLALVLPGYAVMAALFARSSALRPLEWALGSIAGSIVIAAIGGFVLNGTPWGLIPQTWALWLGGITLAAVVIAARRRGDSVIDTSWRSALRVTRGQGIVIGLAALVFVAAIGIAVYGATHTPRPGFTQLWLLPAASGSVRIGIHNLEGTPLSYILRVQADGAPVQTWANVTLQSGETWEMTVALSPQQQQAQTIEALLYRANADGIIYRRVTLER